MLANKVNTITRFCPLKPTFYAGTIKIVFEQQNFSDADAFH